MEIHAIAVDWRAVPITSWTLREVYSNIEIARVELNNGMYRLEGDEVGISAHIGLRSAIAAAEAALLPASRAKRLN